MTRLSPKQRRWQRDRERDMLAWLLTCWQMERRWLTARDLYPESRGWDPVLRGILVELAVRRLVKRQTREDGTAVYAPVREHVDEATCRICGCTDGDACNNDAGPCSWAEGNLCSHCVR